MSERPQTPLLDRVTSPADLRVMSDTDLRRLADELRAETISAVSETGGHLGAGLGVVEMTVAIHATFNTPTDKLIWDVSHQCYPHKILTGRRDRIRTLRKGGGLSGFTKRAESPYDPFGAAHSSTSISAGLGFSVARDLGGAPEYGVGDAVCVIGDGAISAGMAYEGLNNAGALGKRLVVILNDNEMSIGAARRRHVALSFGPLCRPAVPGLCRGGQGGGQPAAATAARGGKARQGTGQGNDRGRHAV